MIRSKRKTKWDSRSRLNVESMLHIGAGKSVNIPHQPQYELTTYSISFFASVNSTFSITKGAFNFTQADLPSLKFGETALITITSSAILKNGIYISANGKVFNNQDDIILSGDFLIGHLAIFGKEISQQEIEYIHTFGGVMPESSHASCVAHWPFTQRYGKTVWDVVEQYNYAKATQADANHASLINYTDLEAGIPDPATNTAWLDFYKKTPIDWIGSVDGDGNIIEKESGLPEIKNALKVFDDFELTVPVEAFQAIGNNDFTIIYDFYAEPRNILSEKYMFYMFRQGTWYYIEALRANGGIRSGINVGSFFGGIGAANVTHVEKPEGLKTIIFERSGISKISTAINGINNLSSMSLRNDIFDLSNYTICYFSSGRQNNFHAVRMVIIEGILTPKEKLAVSNNTLFHVNASKVRAYYLCNNPFDNEGIKFLEDLSGNGNHIPLTMYTADQLNPAHADYVFKPINSLR